VALLNLVFTSMNSVANEYLTVEISHGKIRVVRTEGVNIFKGVPYAGRISGDRLFRQPCPFF
jgi:para-nitrobenzyl esterase